MFSQLDYSFKAPNRLPKSELDSSFQAKPRFSSEVLSKGHAHHDTASTAAVETYTAAFKTSTSLGGSFRNRPPLKWDQPNGKGSRVNITYAFANDVEIPGLNQAQVKALFEEALSTWAEAAPLNFREIADPGNGQAVDIRVSNEFIDGYRNTLAFAFFPSNGDITFDSGDRWSASLFLETALHELGHSLGLAHEEEKNAIMNPMVANRFFGATEAFLFPDDIDGITSLYGRGRGSVRPLGQSAPSPTPTPKRTGNLVRNNSFENDSVSDGKSRILDQLQGWTTLKGAPQVEKRSQIFGAAAKGKAWIELDGKRNSTISQNLETAPGQNYELSFFYSPRPRQDAATNGIKVYWNNQKLDTITQGGSQKSQWQRLTYDVVSSDRNFTPLTFKAVGTSDGVGGFIDKVIVKASANATGSAATYSLGSAEMKEDSFLTAQAKAGFADTAGLAALTAGFSPVSFF